MSVDRGNSTRIVNLNSGHSFEIAATLPVSGEALGRHFTSVSADEVTRLHGVMFVPSDFDERRRYPLIDFVYPGPQNAHQPQSFRSMAAAPARCLAELGFVTLMIDTRGMPVGSRAFHQIGYGELLEPQLADHAAVVCDLCRRLPFIDDQHIGIIGQSAGGAAAARALLDYQEVFKVGVALCGNHDSSLYMAFWSDKYRGSDGRDTWPCQANQSVAHRLEGKLLLIAGDLDENVHISQTLSLVDALIRANRDFDLLVVPNAGHDLLMTHGYAQRRMWDYFVRHLLGEEPPRSFELKFDPDELARYRALNLRELR